MQHSITAVILLFPAKLNIYMLRIIRIVLELWVKCMAAWSLEGWTWNFKWRKNFRWKKFLIILTMMKNRLNYLKKSIFGQVISILTSKRVQLWKISKNLPSPPWKTTNLLSRLKALFSAQIQMRMANSLAQTRIANHQWKKLTFTTRSSPTRQTSTTYSGPSTTINKSTFSAYVSLPTWRACQKSASQSRAE